MKLCQIVIRIEKLFKKSYQCAFPAGDSLGPSCSHVGSWHAYVRHAQAHRMIVKSITGLPRRLQRRVSVYPPQILFFQTLVLH